MKRSLCSYLIFPLIWGIVFASDAPVCSEKDKLLIILDVANDCISKAREFFPQCTDYDEHDPNMWTCERRSNSTSLLESASSLITEAKKSYPKKTLGAAKQNDKPMDCYEVQQNGKNESGIYTIWPRSRVMTNQTLCVYCDMETDGGGWTVIQRRGQFTTPKNYFFKDWQSYKVGFGDKKEDFWLGNDNIFAISNQAPSMIRFDLKDDSGYSAYAKYQKFWIDDEDYNYKLHISGYSGDAGDSMDSNHLREFSTKDRDNDVYRDSCAHEREGAWWYNDCGMSNLNGLNQPGTDSLAGMVWQKWKGDVSLANVEIKVRPLPLP